MKAEDGACDKESSYEPSFVCRSIFFLSAKPFSMLVVEDLVLNVISAYAPQVGHNESTKKELCENLEDMIRSVPNGEKLFIGDLNGHVGISNIGFEEVH
uniref:Craniofacial development protein 2-like n=1 Tax=Arundo donax TaxID=35708 RepID=A0A0A8ZH84_ARUDO